MFQPSYIIELSARYFNVSAKDMLERFAPGAKLARRTSYILLRKHCYLEPYKIAEIYSYKENSVRDGISRGLKNIAVCNAVKEIEDNYLISKEMTVNL